MKRIIILGAGLSGLGFQSKLPQAEIFEAQDHPGGLVYSNRSGKYTFDQGAHIVHSKNTEWLSFLFQQSSCHSIKRSLVTNYSNGQWITYPVQNHLYDLPLSERIEALTQLVDAQARYGGEDPSNYYEWCLFQYGDYLVNNFYRKYTDKYWRTPMEEMSIDWLSGRLLPSQYKRIIAGALSNKNEDQAVFSSFHYPKTGGIYSFFEPLFNKAEINYNARVVHIDPAKKTLQFGNGEQCRYDYLASSIPLKELVSITESCPSHVRECAKKLRYLKLLCVNIIYRGMHDFPFHWFYIYDADKPASRVSIPSNLSSGTYKDELLIQAEVFRRDDEVWTSDELMQQTVKDMVAIMGIQECNIFDVSIAITPISYPISGIDRADAVSIITEWLHSNQIYPMGLGGSWKFMWSDDAYHVGRKTAEIINQQL